jgi:nucleoside-diphosphate-sugar epimerase
MLANTNSGPDLVTTEAELEELLTRPSAGLAGFIKSLSGPLLVLGAGGKMGPTLAVLARRAAEATAHPLEVIAVSRFTDPQARAWLEERGVTTLGGDLLLAETLARLPDAANILYLVGLKFGTAKNPGATWAMNTIVPARVCERYPNARIAALSTTNVYPLTKTALGGASENHPLTPSGEYGNAAVARERIFDFYSRRQETPVALLRLSYAVELRYGVLVDIARKVWSGETISLANGYVSCIWQGDANELAIRSLALAESPPSVWNLCRPEVYSVREVATRLGELLGRAPGFEGAESETALLANSGPLCAALGPPATPLEAMLPLIAHWVKSGGRDLDRPTHFETRDGSY